MANDNTIADAQGNAAAQIYTQIIESPDDTPFETQVTPEMIEKHKYYNDDILQIAEEMKKILERIEQDQEALAKGEQSGLFNEAMRGSILTGIDLNKRYLDVLEQKIKDEIEQVRTEYRRLAENLNDRAEMYRGDYEALGRFLDSELRRNMKERDDLIKSGADPEGVARANQARTEDGYHSFHVEQYAVTWGDYRLLQEGFAITTTREALMNLVWGAAELIALEIITAGLATAVVAAATGTRIGARVIKATARVSENILKQLAARYNKLPERVKTKLDDIFDRIKHGDDRPARDDGTGGRGATRHVDDVPCSAAACAVR